MDDQKKMNEKQGQQMKGPNDTGKQLEEQPEERQETAAAQPRRPYSIHQEIVSVVTRGVFCLGWFRFRCFEGRLSLHPQTLMAP